MVLVLPDGMKPFIVYINAYGMGLGVVLVSRGKCTELCKSIAEDP